MSLFVVGRIRKSFGTKGLVKVEPLTHSVSRFRALKVAYVGKDEGSAERVVVDEATVKGKSVLVKFGGIDNKTRSDELAGRYLFVEEENVVPPPEGSYFVHDVLGCTVWMDGEQIGTVVEVYARTQGFAQDVWVVEGPSPGRHQPKRYWLPAVPSLLTDVDIEARKIVVREIFDFSE